MLRWAILLSLAAQARAQCSAGFFNTSLTDCAPCPPGTFSPLANSTTCTNCSANARSLAGASVCLPMPGYYDVSTSAAGLHRRYTFNSFNPTSRMWMDLSANRQNATVTRLGGGQYNITTSCSSGNGAGASFCAIQGSVNQSNPNNDFDHIDFGNSIPSTYTICAVSRYTGPRNQRILTARLSQANWLFGHWNTGTCSVYWGGVWIVGPFSSTTACLRPVTNWQAICARSVQPFTVVVNGAQQTATASSVLSNLNLVINWVGHTENSDFAIAELTVWNTALPSTVITQVNQLYTSMFNGTVSQTQPQLMAQCNTTCPAQQFARCLSNGNTVCCPAGSTFIEGISTNCTLCPTGAYSTTGAATVCTNCPIGTYQPFTGQSSFLACLTCSNGTFAESITSTTCTMCPLNSWCASGVRNICPLNTISQNGSTVQNQCLCAPGYWGNGALQGTSPCALCWPGFYCPGGNNNLSIACPANSWSQPGASLITDCSCLPGYAGANGTNCTICPLGTFCVSGNLSVCPANTSTLNLASTRIEDCRCIPGMYGNLSIGCTECPIGSYCPGDTQIIACTPNATTAATRSFSSMQCFCDRGFSGFNNTPCVPCPPNFWCWTGVQNQCPPFTTSPQFSNFMQNCTCIPGYAGQPGGPCSACLAGTITSTNNMPSCLQCGVGQTSFDAASTCTNCNPGTYSSAPASSECLTCSAGFFQNQTMASDCLPCAAGNFQSSTGSTGCSMCALGSYTTYLLIFNDLDVTNSISTIRTINVETTQVTTIAGNMTSGQAIVLDGVGPQARFRQTTPGDMITGSEFFTLERAGTRFFKMVSLHTRAVRTIPGVITNTPTWCSNFNTLLYCWYLSSRQIDVYFMGNTTRVARIGAGLAINRDGNSTFASFSGVGGMAMRPDGQELLVIGGFQLRTINLTTLVTTTIAGNGTGVDVDGIGLNAAMTAGVVNYGPQNAYCLLLTFTGSGLLRYVNLTTYAVTTLRTIYFGTHIQYVPGFDMFFIGSLSAIFRITPGTWQQTTVQNLVGSADGVFGVSRSQRPVKLALISTPASTSCTLCPVSSFSDTQNADSSRSCQTCPVGTFGTGLGMSACTLCPPGFFRNFTGATSCDFCRLGTFQSAAGQTSCELCPPGTFENFTNASICDPCAAGSFSTAIGAFTNQVCTGCDAGLFSTALAASSSAVCTNCSIGTFSPQGASSCLLCAPGTYSSAIATPTCLNCSTGFYQPLNGSNDCMPCDAGFFQGQSGSSACQSCALGSYTTYSMIFSSFVNGAGRSTLIIVDLETRQSRVISGNSTQLGSRPGMGTDALWMNPTVMDKINASHYPVVDSWTQQRRLFSIHTLASTPLTHMFTPTCANYFQRFFCFVTNRWQELNIFSTVALQNIGTGTNTNQDGNRTTASFHTSVTASLMRWDGEEFFFLNNNQLRRMNTTTYITTTIAGSGTAVSVDGTGLNAAFSFATGIACDYLNTYCLVLEQNANGRLRRVNLTTGQVQTVGPVLPWFISLIYIPVLDFFLVHGDGVIRIVPPGTWSQTAFFSGLQRTVRIRFIDTPAATNCTLCPIGTFSNTPNADSSRSCQNCPAGTFGTGIGLSACDPCPSGSFSTGTGQRQESTCLSCAAGSFSTALGAMSDQTCTPCFPGSISTAPRSSNCSLCPPWAFINQSGLTACLSCTPGTYASVSGCLQCPSGSYLTGTGASSVQACLSCPAGTFSTGFGFIALSNCTSCPAGTFSLLTGAPSLSNCSLCPAGRFSTTVGSTMLSNCALCPSGTFSTALGLTGNCTACFPFSNSTPGSPSNQSCRCTRGYQGNASCTACAAGTFSSASGGLPCVSCSAGSFSTGLASSVCDFCPAGSSNPYTGQDRCRPCDAGSYSTAIGSTVFNPCILCELGKASSEPGAAFCPTCENGTYSEWPGSVYCNPCPDGQFATGSGLTTINACQNCQPGTFRPLLTEDLSAFYPLTTACSLCAPGSFNNLAGQSACFACNPGSFMQRSNATACLPCAPGTFNPVFGLSGNCTACPALTWSVSPGSSSIDDCLCGASYEGSGLSCTLCNIGWYKSGIGQFCSFCDAGTFSTGQGSTNCSLCPPGTAQDTPGQWRCTNCTAGTYSTEWGRTYRNCEYCDLGTFGTGIAASACTMCPSGTFQETLAVSSSSFCYPCDAGTFSTTLGLGDMMGCTACPSGSFSSAQRSANCSLCLPGTYATQVSTSACTVCLTGTFQTGAGMRSLANCTRCGAGTFQSTTGVTTSASCTLCSAGTFSTSLGASACVACPAGSFSSSLGLIQNCTLCGAGTFSTSLGATSPPTCAFCASGSFSTALGASVCQSCPANSWCASGAQNLCPQNTRSPSNSTSQNQCTCNAGYVGDGSISGTSPCALCFSGNYCPGGNGNTSIACPRFSTSPPGSNLITQCQCLPGYYGPNGTNCSACLVGFFCASGFISSCPANMTSPNTSSAVQSCVCAPGFFGNLSTGCRQCPISSFCPGGQNSIQCTGNATTAGLQTISAAQCFCDRGYQGVNNTPCTPCPTGTWCWTGILNACPSLTNSPPLSSFVTNCTCNRGYEGNPGGPCSACPAGRFGLTHAGGCVNCSAGFYSTGLAQQACLACSAGLFSLSVGATAVSTCLPCSIGQFSTALGATNCSLCPVGTRNNNTGMVNCTLCEAGGFGTGLGFTSQCSACSPGRFSTTLGATSNLTCSLCAPGTFSNLSSTTACTLCQAGRLQTGSGFTNCSLCAAGSFFTGLGRSTDCPTCLSGTYATALGLSASSDCLACTIQFYCTGGSRISCPSNTWSYPSAQSPHDCLCYEGYACARRRRVRVLFRNNLTSTVAQRWANQLSAIWASSVYFNLTI